MATPTWTKACDTCGTEVSRYRGQAHPSCRGCHTEYNASGQRLRDNWRSNASNWDEDVDDMAGYEAAAAAYDARELYV